VTRRIGLFFLALLALLLVPVAPVQASVGKPHPKDIVQLTIHTVPTLPGAVVKLDDKTFVTDVHGVAIITQPHDLVKHSLTVVTPIAKDPKRRYVFSRWAGASNPQLSRNEALRVSMRGSHQYTASFASQYAVQPTFVDQAGLDVSSQVTRASIKSDSGQVIKVPTSGTIWVPETRISSTANKLSVKNVRYTWQSMIVSGSNVLDAGRQSFFPAKTQVIKAQGRFHDLTIAGHDALFGGGTGTQALITYPDGSVRTVPMDGAHQIVVKHLPRGTYQVMVRAGAAIVASHQIRLSRSTVLAVPVISVIDISVLVVSGLAVICVVLSLRRERFRRRLLAPFRWRRGAAA
jgi:hypothetical protein